MERAIKHDAGANLYAVLGTDGYINAGEYKWTAK